MGIITYRPNHMKFPNGLDVDVNNPPGNFEELIRESFGKYTEGTNKDYTFVDKLSYIDLMRKYAHRYEDAALEVTEYIKERFEYELDEFGEFMEEEDFKTIEVMTDVYERGQLDLKDNYTGDHHIDEKIMKLLVRAIKVVIDYEKG